MNMSNVEPVGRMTNIYNNSMVKYYNFVIHELSDPRTHDWFLISSPILPGSILIAYLYFTLSWGPRYMQHRKPYDLKKVLVLYNFFQVIVSMWIFWEGLDSAWLRHYSWRCQPVDTSYTPRAFRVLRVVYVYFLCKMTELLDTVFFVFRKKNNQITFLHVYHHTAMAMAAWGVTKYFPGGHATFIGLINSFVHIIMYGYYLLSAVVPQKYLWWKKYITTLQLFSLLTVAIAIFVLGVAIATQFGIATLHSCQLLFYDCNFPRWSLILIIPNAIFFTFMFLDFYKKAYADSATKPTASGIQELEKNGKLQTAKGKTD